MKCIRPTCAGKTRVIDSEVMPSGTQRARVHKCDTCGHVFRTTETIDPEYLPARRGRATA